MLMTDSPGSTIHSVLVLANYALTRALELQLLSVVDCAIVRKRLNRV